MDQATYATMPESIVMREVRVADLTLVTTLLDADEVGKLELVDLYGKRWQIELDFRSIKTVMQMEILRCKSPEMIRKEIAAHLLAYNLVRTVMAQAACLAHLLPRQLSFKATLQVLNAFEENLRFCPRARLTTRHAIVLASIGQVILPVRPDRVEPRAVKRRPKPHKLLTEPRYVLRQRTAQTARTTRRMRLKVVPLGAEIFFWDESGFRADSVHGKTWGVRGQTPVVQRPGQRQSISAASAVNASGAFWFCTYEGGLNAELFVELLGKMMKYRSKPIHLVLDSLPAHKTALVKKYVASTEGRLTLHFLPGYAPDLNPDELVWSHVKRTGTARRPLQKGEKLRDKIKEQLATLQKLPHLVRSFFNAPSVAYIGDC